MVFFPASLKASTKFEALICSSQSDEFSEFFDSFSSELSSISLSEVSPKEIHDPFCFACTLGLLPCLLHKAK
jgi:hypothetical protein